MWNCFYTHDWEGQESLTQVQSSSDAGDSCDTSKIDYPSTKKGKKDSPGGANLAKLIPIKRDVL